MESFFLAETTKYLYLLFDPDNFLNNDGKSGITIQTSQGECVVDTGAYIFNTEAHPIDSSALKCCYDIPYKQLVPPDQSSSEYLGDIIQIDEDIENITRTNNIKIIDQKSEDITIDNLKDWLNSNEDKSEFLKLLDDMKKPNSTNDSSKYDNILSLYGSLIELNELESGVFNAQRLLEFIRENFDDANVSKNYELMGCKSQTFVQRLAVLGETLT